MRPIFILLLVACSKLCMGAEVDFAVIAKSMHEVALEQVELIRTDIATIRTAKPRYNRELKQPRYDAEKNYYWFRSPKDKRTFLKTRLAQFTELKQKIWIGEFVSIPDLEFKDFAAERFGVPLVLTNSGRTASGALGSRAGSAGAYATLAYLNSPMVHNRLRAHAVQVWDGTEVLVRLAYPGLNSSTDVGTAVILNAPESLQRDDAWLKLGAVHVSGNRKYDSNFGERTIFELTLLGSEFHQQLREAIADYEPSSKQPRKWSSADGAFSTVASLRAYDGKTVSLLPKSGKEIEVPITKLSKLDIEFTEIALGTQ